MRWLCSGTLFVVAWLILCGKTLGADVESSNYVEGSDDILLVDTPNPHQLRLNKPPHWNTTWLQNLPPLPALHSPDSPTWSNSLAVCAIMRDENITDVREWLQYYQWLGVDHVFLTDNDSADGDWLLRTLATEFAASFLSLRRETTEKAQLKAYAWCAEEQRAAFNWIAFFDLDEYLVLRQPSTEARAPTIKELLDDYKHSAGLSVSWVLFGPGRNILRPESGGVLRAYQMCVPEADRHIKTIVNTFYLSGVAVHPHNFDFRDNMVSVNEQGHRLERVWKPWPQPYLAEGLTRWKPKDCARAGERPDLNPYLNSFCFNTAAPMVAEPTIDRVALFHYGTKSVQDFAAKMKRGSGMSLATKGRDYLEALQREQRNKPLCREAARLRQLCCLEPTEPAGDAAAAAATTMTTTTTTTKYEFSVEFWSRDSDGVLAQYAWVLWIGAGVVTGGSCGVAIGLLFLAFEARRARRKRSEVKLTSHEAKRHADLHAL